MVKLTRIYTRGGDKGETSLGNGQRVAKDDLRVSAYGAVDELNAALGLIRAFVPADSEFAQQIGGLQNDLFDAGADLAVPEDPSSPRSRLRVTQNQIDRLEKEIDAMNERLGPLESFILPGGNTAAAQAHMARALARRAERDIVSLMKREEINPLVLTYVNRLSDHLFVLARALNNWGKGDLLWQPGQNREEKEN